MESKKEFTGTLNFKFKDEFKDLLNKIKKEQNKYKETLNPIQKKIYEFQEMIIKANIIYGENGYDIVKTEKNGDLILEIIPKTIEKDV